MTPSPKLTTIVFVRHGVTATTGKELPGRSPGLHLSDAGKAAAEELGAAFGEYGKIDAIYSSPLERTRETATPIAKACGLKVRIEKNLLELDPGDWTGKSLKSLVKKPEWRQLQFYPGAFRFPGGESFSELNVRMKKAVETICENHPGQTVVAVSHGDPINLVLADAIGVHIDTMQRLQVSPTSVSIVTYTAERPIVMAINATADAVTKRMHP